MRVQENWPVGAILTLSRLYYYKVRQEGVSRHAERSIM